MALVFPSNPSVNDTYQVNGRTYVWNGTTWKRVSVEVPDVLPTLTVDNNFSAGGTLHVDSTNNEIGIGTAAPSHQLHLTQDLGVDGNLIVGGTITVPTPVSGTNDTKVATTEFVQTAVSNLVDSAPSTLDTLNELAAALGDDANFATTVTNALAGKLDSSSYTAADVLAKLITVDGSGSSLDADTLDGSHASAFAASSHSHSYLPLSGGTMTGSITIASGSSVNAFAGGSNYWRPQDAYGNSYFDINSGQFYVDSDTYYFRNRASVNNMTIDSSGNTYVRGWLETSGRIYPRNWIEFSEHEGLLSPLNTAYFYPNNGSYGSWRVAGTRNAWQGLEFDTSNGQFSLMMTASGNNYTGVHHNGWGWKWYFVNQDLYCNAYRGFNNVAGTGNASYHPNGIYSTGTNWLYGQIITNNNQINAGSGSIFSGRMQPSLSNAGSAYTSVQCELRSTFGNGGVAGITGHIVNHLAPVLRVWTGTGEGFDCNNSAGTVYAYVGGSQFITRSSGRFKKHIKERDNSEVIPRALDLLACRTVIWDDTYLDGEWCEESGCIVNKEVCDDENCECECCSTARVDPINRRHFNRRGYLAEELAEVLPEAVHFESDGTPSGIDYSMVTVELMDMVKLLVLQCEDQERRIKELEYANA